MVEAEAEVFVTEEMGMQRVLPGESAWSARWDWMWERISWVVRSRSYRWFGGAAGVLVGDVSIIF